MLAEYLAGEGLGAFAVHDGLSGETAAMSGKFDLVVLDVMLPNLSGLEGLRRIRRSIDVPVLLLTARAADVPSDSGRNDECRTLGDGIVAPSYPQSLAAMQRS